MARTAEIGECVEVVSGPAFNSAQFTDDPSDGPLIKGENVAQGYIAWDKSKFWPVNDTEGFERFGLGAGDIVLAMDRPWITAGLKWVRLRPHDSPSLLVQRVARLRTKPGLRQDYLTNVIASAQFSEYARNIMGGTNVPHISGPQIKAFKFRLPGENEQAAIADILSAYDDLIETNRRRIALLEESARLLYREWFVHFRFPGHEHVSFTDGLSEDWARVPAAEAFEVNPKTSRNDDGVIRYIPMSALSETGMVIDRGPVEDRDKYTSVRFRNGDTLLARITPCLENGKTGYVQFLSEDEVACGSTEFIVLRGRRVSNYIVYLTARQHDFRQNAIRSMIGSSGRQRVQPSCFDRYLVPTPSQVLSTLFDEAVGDMFTQIGNLDQQNQKLAQARDPPLAAPDERGDRGVTRGGFDPPPDEDPAEGIRRWVERLQPSAHTQWLLRHSLPGEQLAAIKDLLHRNQQAAAAA